MYHHFFLTRVTEVLHHTAFALKWFAVGELAWLEGAPLARIAVDVGGTFTDLVAIGQDGSISTAKTLTTPSDHAEGILNSVDEADIDLTSSESFVHGSTIAINTVLQRRGAKTALITTQGFRDAYEIARGNRPDAYNLWFQRPQPLVPRRHRYEVAERMSPTGVVWEELDRRTLDTVIERLAAEGIEAVAVCLLHAYANAEHELAVGEALNVALPNVYVSLSHQIMREYREYERTSTTVLNAYVGPTLLRYLDSLERRLAERDFSGRLLIMQSNGGAMSVGLAKRTPVRMMESGPVSGVIGAAEIGMGMGIPDVISFDMGGTTAKSSLVRRGQVQVSDGYYIGGYETGHPMQLPVVDIVEVGSGGGSIAWLDDAGGLKVGPVSAGAEPGPASYGRGGDQPTITDANVVLGRLGSESFLGGDMPLDAAAARRSVEDKVAQPLQLATDAAATGIVDIGDAQMSLSVRAVSVRKGEDPRDYALVASGGAGPLHATLLARELNIGRVIIPVLPGQFSAWGMLACDVRHDLVQTMIGLLKEVDPSAVEAALKRSEEEVRARLHEDLGDIDESAIQTQRFLQLRYKGQEFTVDVPLGDSARVESALGDVRSGFDRMHHNLYGHSAPDEPVEMVGLRVAVRSPLPGSVNPFEVMTQRGVEGRARGAPQTRDIVLHPDCGPVTCAVHQREELKVGEVVHGPAVVEERSSTALLLEGDRLEVASNGALVIEIAHEEREDA